jgi:hypothetical protein
MPEWAGIQFLKRNGIRKPDQGKGLRILPSGMKNGAGKFLNNRDDALKRLRDCPVWPGRGSGDPKTIKRRDFYGVVTYTTGLLYHICGSRSGYHIPGFFQKKCMFFDQQGFRAIL